MTLPVIHEHSALASERLLLFEKAENDGATGTACTKFLPVASSTLKDIVSHVTLCTKGVVMMRPARTVLSQAACSEYVSMADASPGDCTAVSPKYRRQPRAHPSHGPRPAPIHGMSALLLTRWHGGELVVPGGCSIQTPRACRTRRGFFPTSTCPSSVGFLGGLAPPAPQSTQKHSAAPPHHHSSTSFSCNVRTHATPASEPRAQLFRRPCRRAE